MCARRARSCGSSRLIAADKKNWASDAIKQCGDICQSEVRDPVQCPVGY